MTVVLAALAGGLGALVRGEVTVRLGTRRATALVNLAGAFLLGLVVGLAEGDLSSSSVLVVGAGFAGGMTTFSTWMVDTARRERALQWRAVLVTLGAGMLVAAVGWLLGGLL